MRQHLLQLYDDAGYMLDRVGEFLRTGAQADEAVVVIATPPHAAAVSQALGDLDARLVVRDARSMLDQVMRGDRVEPALFKRHVGGLFEEAAQGASGVRGFGEMVALLWEDDQHEAAVRLERLWDQLSGSHRYALICAYPLASMSTPAHGAPFLAICDGHSHVFAAEPVPVEPQDRILLLERESKALRGELSRRLDVQHELSRSDESKDDFIAVLAHELRNPLTPILTAVEMLKRPMDADQQQKLVATIGRQTSVLARLVEDLLEARRVTSGHISIARKLTSVHDILEQAVETNRPRIDARNQRLEVVCDRRLAAEVDPLRIGQAVSNLLHNASKFTPEGGRLTLRAAQEDACIRIEVEDSGRGMDVEFLARAFEPYAQARVGEGGLGLGLAIVRSIVRLHGGTVDARSAGPGLGTTFRILLPCAASAAADPTPTATLRPAAPGARILVVDDNEDVRETLAALLSAYGHQARTAGSGAEALAALKDPPDVVLLDLGMPGMDGFEVARRMRQGRQVPLIVALSGHAMGKEAAEAGFDHQFTKPPDVERLLEVVEASRLRSMVN